MMTNSTAYGFMDPTRFVQNHEAPAEAYPLNKCKVILKNQELWKKFHNLQTEMIITKSGRRMFPSFNVQVENLDPNAYYCVYLYFLTPPDSYHCRYKYTASAGWTPAGTEEAQSDQRRYLHPESPAKGDYWMSQPISFGRLKLTNTPNAPDGQIVLSSMHKYQPRLVFVKTNNPRSVYYNIWSPSTYCSVEFPETQFIAVTAYQNEKITQLKIDNNPFAKGFRENGQAKCKRKRTHNEEDNTAKIEGENSTKRLRTSSENSIDFIPKISENIVVKQEEDEQISVCSSPRYSSRDSSSCCSANTSLTSPRIANLKQESRCSVSSPRGSLSSEASSPVSSPNSPINASFYPAYSSARLGYSSGYGAMPNVPLNNNYYPYSYRMYYGSPYSGMFGVEGNLVQPVPYFYGKQYYDYVKMEAPKDLSGYKGQQKDVKKFTDFSISSIIAK